MRITIVGSKGTGKGAHFSEGLAKAFDKMNHKVYFYDPLDFCDKNEQVHGKPIPISVFNKNSDLIFIDQCNFQFKRDFDALDVITMYNHKYLHRHPRVYYPDVMFHACEPFRDFFVRQEHKWYCYNVQRHEILYPAVDPDLYDIKEKDIKMIIGIGFRRSFNSWLKASGIAEGATNKLIEKEVDVFKDSFKFYDTPITDDEYKDLVSRACATWFPIPSNQYITRRMLEAMICRTVCFMKIEDKQHEQVLENMGYKRSIDYVGVDKVEQIRHHGAYIHSDNEYLAEKAYETTIKNHTYESRAKQILKLYDEMVNK